MNKEISIDEAQIKVNTLILFIGQYDLNDKAISRYDKNLRVFEKWIYGEKLREKK